MARRVQYLAACLLLGATGCHDSPSDPLGGLTTVETAPSLALSAPLPSPAELLSNVPADPAVREEADRWTRSWEMDGSREVRDVSRARIAEHLARSMTAEGVESALRPLAWVRAEVADGPPLPEELALPLQEAEILVDRAMAELEAGRLREALEAGLAASDLYRSVTPRAVATRLVARAEGLMSQVEATSETGGLARGERLLAGARRALEEGEHTTAIHRAFYACQVLEGAPVEGRGPGMDDPGRN